MLKITPKNVKKNLPLRGKKTLKKTLKKTQEMFDENLSRSSKIIGFSSFLPSSAAQRRKFSFLSVSTAIYLWNSLDFDENILDDQKIMMSISAKIVKNNC